MLEALLIAAILRDRDRGHCGHRVMGRSAVRARGVPAARLVVGAVALIAILWVLLRLVRAGLPGLP